MSLPTLRNDLSKIYEPKAPAPTQRLATLKAAKDAGLHVYVAIAPTYPECDEDDLRATISAIKNLDPITVFHEPINLRAENAARIAAAASKVGLPMQTEVFETQQAWQSYALTALQTVWRLSNETGIRDKIHLWPDKVLGSKQVVLSAREPKAYLDWLQARWSRISEWPELHSDSGRD
jgi:DNA repair photolyase